MDLVVVGAFGTYAVGDRITDQAAVTEHKDRADVVRTVSPPADVAPAHTDQES